MLKVDGVNFLNNKVVFKGENDCKISDNNVSKDEGMKQSTKLMIGATALATAVVAGIALIKGRKPQKPETLDNAVDNVVQEVRKSVHDMYGEELAQWSETKIKQIQKLFDKKRDLTDWGKFNDGRNKPHAPFQSKGFDLFNLDDAGHLFIENQYLKSRSEVHKAYTKDGLLDEILIRNDKKFVKIHRKQDGGFYAEFGDRNSKNHRHPSVKLDITPSEEGFKYKTSLIHDVRSEQYYPKEYETVSGPKPKKEKEIEEPQE